LLWGILAVAGVVFEALLQAQLLIFFSGLESIQLSHRTCGSQPAGDDNFIITTVLTGISLSLAG
jgi:hypothetical protein